MTPDPYKGLVRTGNPFLVLDVLLIDGGWWTVDGLVVRTGVAKSVVDRALFRLRDRGRVVSRKVELTAGEFRTEWRAV